MSSLRHCGRDHHAMACSAMMAKTRGLSHPISEEARVSRMLE